MDTQEKLDPLSPEVIMAFIMAFLGDALFMFILPHYFVGVIILPLMWPRFRGWFAKLIFGLCVLLPVPLLIIGLFLGIILSNKFIAFLAEQAIIQGVAAVTGGAGEVLEGAAIAGETAEVGEVAIEAEQAAAAVAEAGGAIAEGGAAVGEGATAAGEAAAEAGELGADAGEAAGAAGEAGEEGEGLADQLENWKDRLDQLNQQGSGDDNKDERDEDYERMMETESQRDIQEVLEEKYFSLQDANGGRTDGVNATGYAQGTQTLGGEAGGTADENKDGKSRLEQRDEERRRKRQQEKEQEQKEEFTKLKRPGTSEPLDISKHQPKNRGGARNTRHDQDQQDQQRRAA